MFVLLQYGQNAYRGGGGRIEAEGSRRQDAFPRKNTGGIRNEKEFGKIIGIDACDDGGFRICRLYDDGADERRV